MDPDRWYRDWRWRRVPQGPIEELDGPVHRSAVSDRQVEYLDLVKGAGCSVTAVYGLPGGLGVSRSSERVEPAVLPLQRRWPQRGEEGGQIGATTHPGKHR